jgi:branched-chain amino acid transport system substrate-binding protein
VDAAVREACSADRDAIRDSLGELEDVPTPLGSFSFEEREPQHPAVVQIVKDGKFAVLD